MTQYIIALIQLYSSIYKVDSNLVYSIAKVESEINNNSVGKYGELGVMQLLPSSYPEYSLDELKDVETNVKLAVKTIASLKRNCRHKANYSYVVCYNRGLTGGNKVEDYTRNSYYRKVMKHMYASVKKRQVK